MNEIKIFENPDFGKVRTVMMNDEPYFVGKDVAEILGYTNTNKAIQVHVDDEDKFLRSERGTEMGKLFSSLKEMQDYLGRQDNWFINESGLYSLILSSKLPTAKKFKHWVTSEVLPSIRKTGAYSTEQPKTQAEALLDSVKLLVEQERRIAAIEAAQEAQGKEVKRITDIMSLRPDNWRSDTNTILRRIAQAVGGGDAYRDIRKESYELLEKRMGCDLHIRLKNAKERMLQAGTPKAKIKAFNKADIIAADKKLVEGYINVVKDMAIHYGISDAIDSVA